MTIELTPGELRSIRIALISQINEANSVIGERPRCENLKRERDEMISLLEKLDGANLNLLPTS